MNPSPVGILSTAHPHWTAYAQAAKALDDVELVGTTGNPAPENGTIPDVDVPWVSPNELLDEIEIGIICSTNASHREWVEKAAAAGVHLLCEKPLGVTAQEAEEIVNICSAYEVTLGVAMPLRFSDPAQHARALVNQGEIGDLKMISGTNLLRSPGAEWFFDPAQAGGGAIIDHTVHIVDLVRWITGEEVTEVFAETGTKFHDAPVEDINLLSMELADGTPFTHDGSWCQPDSWDFWGDATLRLIGTEGIIDIDCFDQTLKVTRDVPTEEGLQSIYWGTDVNKQMISNFVMGVRNGSAPEVTGVDGVREMAVVEAAYSSAAHGIPVTVGTTR